MRIGQIRRVVGTSAEGGWAKAGLRTTLVGLACALLVLAPIGGGAASATTPTLAISQNNVTVNGGVPFAYSVGFTVNGTAESDPISLTDKPSSAAPGLTILSVPPQFGWNCSATNIAAQVVSCVYTPSAPLATGTFVSLSVEADAAYNAVSTGYQAADSATVSSADAGSVSANPATDFTVYPDGVVLDLNLSDSLGAGHSTTTGSNFDYLANVTITYANGQPYTPQETQPITVADPMPAGTALTQKPSGTDWDCSASNVTTAICTYTPPALGIGGTALPTIVEPAQLTDPTLGDAILNTAQVVSPDTAGASSSDSVTVGSTTPVPAVTVTVSGSQTLASSTPGFDYYGNNTSVPITGALTCGTVNAGTGINASLGLGSYTIDGSSCSGLSVPSGYAISYVGAPNDYLVAANPPSFADSQLYTFSWVAGVPFVDTPNFTVSQPLNVFPPVPEPGPESKPIAVTFSYAGYGPVTILGVPAQSSWNCSPPDNVALTISCTYTPTSPLLPGTFVSLDVEIVAPYSPDTYLIGNGDTVSSSDALTTQGGSELIQIDPNQGTLNLNLGDSLGAGHAAAPGAGFDYLANVTSIQASANTLTETQPITVTDPMPTGVQLTATPYGTDWNCSTSSASEAICTYTPSSAGLAGAAGLPTITMPAKVTDTTVGDSLTNTATVSSTDTAGGTGSDTVTVASADKTPPTVTNVVATPTLATLGNGTTLSATVADTEAGGTNVVAAQYNINGGAWVSMSGTFGSPTVNVTAAVPAPAAPVADTLCVRGEDSAGNWSDGTACTSFVVYNPTGGFVTGGGWITSPTAACADATICGSAATGKATFGFVSKYAKGASIPSGNTEYVFHAGNLNFSSSTYQWLVVNQNGTNAQFKGSGTINGTGNYTFMIWATAGSPNTFRIQITNSATNTTVYDSGTQALGGGSIIVHT